ncbi:hypothetical protein QYF61_027004 [Mycteria americana]|uniref:Maestro/Maestro-like HEAT-repeats domain-containing protein n=1 Tax=Mycteria americana TaxID=33587 RepID=A0AAN7N4S3_MYCAM|nr:hypothetical protein QYF61_027004 [Mycteria americana]
MVMLELLYVLQDWPLHSTFTSDGDNTDIFALAATRALWEILRLPRCPQRLKARFSSLFVALLFQIFFSTEQMPEEINTFWRKCQQEGCLPTSPNRFVVLTVKALLCRLEYEELVFEFERKRGWDTLLNAETCHCAMGLLARELRVFSRSLCYSIAHYLVQLLGRKDVHWEVPAMAFLVELLACPDIMGRNDRILQLLQTYLWSECRVMHRLVLRGLIALCTTPSMAKRMRFLLQSLIELLQDEDGEVVQMTLFVLRKVLLAADIPMAGPVALQLAERLRPLFDNDSNYVRLFSIYLFRHVMELVVDVGKQPLKTHVQQSLIPLLCHLHDENQHVAEASRKTLLEATKFLKKRELTQLLEREQARAVGECLLAENRSTADEYLHQTLPYLQSPQEPMREAAIRFIGEPQTPGSWVGWPWQEAFLGSPQMRALTLVLFLSVPALQGMTNDLSPSVSELAAQTLELLRAAERNPFSRLGLPVLPDQLRRVWRRRPSLRDNGWLCCCSSTQS